MVQYSELELFLEKVIGCKGVVYDDLSVRVVHKIHQELEYLLFLQYRNESEQKILAPHKLSMVGLL